MCFRRPLSRFLASSVAGGVMLMGVSCTGWPSGWRAARESRSADGLSGAWLGTWESGRNGHSGKLRCAVFPLPPPPGTALRPPAAWQFRYRASWAKVLCAGFTVDCEAVPQRDGSWRVRGERDLGPLFGGVFTHTGTVQGGVLSARYSAAVDEGTLTLRKLAPE